MKDVYNELASSWYQRRHYSRFGRELAEIAQRWGKGRLLNIGCAHGPDFLPFRQGFDLWGLDISSKMLKLARKYAAKFNFKVNLIGADARFLPYRRESFDWVIAVAAYHHLAGKEARIQAFGELREVLKPGGEALITVWNRHQPRFWFSGKEVMVPWRLKDRTLERYYYLFSCGELKKLARAAGFEVLKMFPEKSHRFWPGLFPRNICLLVKRPDSSV